MTEQANPSTETKENTEQKKPGRPAKGVNVANKSGRMITLIASRNNKETILPTETKELTKDFMDAIRKNKAAMTFFDSGDLVEV